MAKLESSFSVFVQRDGIVNHSHAGVKGWHNPASSHNAASHDGADKPSNLASLSAEYATQYTEALTGKSFYALYTAALTARRSEGAPGTGARKVAAPIHILSGADFDEAEGISA